MYLFSKAICVCGILTSVFTKNIEITNLTLPSDSNTDVDNSDAILFPGGNYTVNVHQKSGSTEETPPKIGNRIAIGNSGCPQNHKNMRGIGCIHINFLLKDACLKMHDIIT